MFRLGMTEGVPIESKMISNKIAGAQKSVEASLRDSQFRFESLQSELLHVSRLTDMGHVTAAIALRRSRS